MTPSNLQQYEGKTGVIRFSDGHSVRARIVHVDEQDRNEVIYDVVEVLSPGRPEWANIVPGTTATAPLADVTDFQQGGS